MKTNRILLGLFTLLLLSACGPSGPSYEERKALNEDKKRERIQQLQSELDQFARKNSAKSVDLVSLVGTDYAFTALLQQEVEGEVVAFRATLLDVQRNPDGDYEAIFGDKFFGTTLIRLSTSAKIANEMLKNPGDFTEAAFVAARIDRISRNLLTAQVCSESDCNTVSIEVDSFFKSYLANGHLIDLEH